MCFPSLWIVFALAVDWNYSSSFLPSDFSIKSSLLSDNVCGIVNWGTSTRLVIRRSAYQIRGHGHSATFDFWHRKSAVFRVRLCWDCWSLQPHFGPSHICLLGTSCDIHAIQLCRCTFSKKTSSRCGSRKTLPRTSNDNPKMELFLKKILVSEANRFY